MIGRVVAEGRPTAGAGRRLLLALACALGIARGAAAHSGPPFPIVSDRDTGPYTVSLWTDPDTTDDGVPGGQFWVVLAPRGTSDPVPAGTRATIVAEPLDRPGPMQSAVTEPVRGDSSNQFGAVVLDHEGPFRIRIVVQGPLGDTTLDGQVDATYDLRPPPALILLYLLPFVAVGLLWTKLLLRRRAAGPGRPSSMRAPPV
jgi:hypothetical protein